MQKKNKRFYYNNRFANIVFKLPRWIYDIYKYNIQTDTQFIKSRFRYEFGRKLDLKNPKTINEKIQWLKINDRRDIYTTCADKFAVRDYIKNKIGDKYLIPLELITNKAEDLKPENLPDYPVIIKPTHGSGMYKVVNDKSTVNWNQLRKTMQKWLKINFYNEVREWQYKNIPPAIIVEKLLLDKNGKIPHDIKFHCFHGEIEYIAVHENRLSDIKETHYDENWNILKFKSFYEKGTYIEPPSTLNEMKRIARILSKDFHYVRVDLYELNPKIYFGELTFHPGSGYIGYEPEEQDLILGNKLNLPIEVDYY